MAEGENILSIERALEILEARMVKTSKGPYISVEDLKELAKEFKEAKADRDQMAPLRTLAQAKLALKSDPEFLAGFDEPIVRAPADSAVVKREGEETTHAA